MADHYAIMRIEKLHSVNAMQQRARHNERKINVKSLKTTPNIKKLMLDDSPFKTQKNTPTTARIKNAFTGYKPRKNAVYGFEIVLTTSPNALNPNALRQWAQESSQWIGAIFGYKNVQSLILHLDETTPHIHAICTPFDENDRMNANGIIRGPKHLRELQTQYAEKMEHFGLCRGISKKLTHRQHKTLQEWYANENAKATRLRAYERAFGTEESWDIEHFIKFQKNLIDEPEVIEKNNISIDLDIDR